MKRTFSPVLTCVSGVHGLSVHADCFGRVNASVPDRAAGCRSAGAPSAGHLHRGRRQHSHRGEGPESWPSRAPWFSRCETGASVFVFLSGSWSSSRPIRLVWLGHCSSLGSWWGTLCLGPFLTGSAGGPSTWQVREKRRTRTRQDVPAFSSCLRCFV